MGAETSFPLRKFCTGREKRTTPEGELDETGERHTEKRKRKRGCTRGYRIYRGSRFWVKHFWPRDIQSSPFVDSEA